MIVLHIVLKVPSCRAVLIDGEQLALKLSLYLPDREIKRPTFSVFDTLPATRVGVVDFSNGCWRNWQSLACLGNKDSRIGGIISLEYSFLCRHLKTRCFGDYKCNRNKDDSERTHFKRTGELICSVHFKRLSKIIYYLRCVRRSSLFIIVFVAWIFLKCWPIIFEELKIIQRDLEKK